MQPGDGIDRETDWLLQQRANGLSQQTIADLIGSTQETVSRNLKAVDEGRQISPDTRRKTRSYRSKLEAVAEARRQAEVDREKAIRQEATDRQDAIRQEAEDREEVQRQNEADCARRRSATERWEGLKESLRELERVRYTQLGMVNERLTQRGIDVGSKIYGDGVKFARTLEPFHHLDEGAELVAFSPEDHLFSSGQTAGELREDVSDWLRMQKKAVPDDAVWPSMIGGRQTDLITLQPYPYERWFWGRHADLIARWRDLRSFTSTWRRNGRPPRLPSDIDVSWLEELITIERQIIDAGLTFEESIPSWRDAWAVEAEVSDEALLQHLHRRAQVLEVLSAPVVIVTGIVTGIVRGIVRGIVTVVVGHPKLVMAVATCIAIFLLRDIIAAIALWMWSGGAAFLAFLGVVAGKFGDIIDAIGRGIDAIARSIDNTKRTISDAYDAVVAFARSPFVWIIPCAIFLIPLVVALIYINDQKQAYRYSSSRRLAISTWAIITLMLSGIGLLVTLIAWVFSYEDINVRALLGLQ